MKNYFLYFLFLLLSINKINSDNDDDIKDIYRNCPQGNTSLSCQEKCNCELWSYSNTCSKIEGRCIDCRFGHFGQNCKDICKPNCKTNLCCAINSDGFKKKEKTINSDISLLNIFLENNKKEKIPLNISTDYNVGYPLAIFIKNTPDVIESDLGDETQISPSYKYSNYNIQGNMYNVNITIKGSDNKELELNVPIIIDRETNSGDNNINGVMGLGFLNTINVELFNKKDISLNIASYKIDKNQIKILFGYLFKNQKTNVDKLSYCDAVLNEKRHTVLKCPVEGMKIKTHSDALELEDMEISFALNEKSSFILNDSSVYKNYIKKYYFNNKYNQEIKDNETSISYYCFKSNKINKLTSFGFVINKYYYSYQADKFFEEDPQCPKGYSRFVIGFSNEKQEIIFGKDLLSEVEFTIDNEEQKIYFYTRNVEYFSKKIIKEFTSEPRIISNPLESSLIAIGVVFGMNVLSFLVYFYFKRKKSK